MIALLSIHPEYVRLMSKGEKRVEFRRARFRHELTHVVVYATSPERRIVGYFEVVGIDEGSATSLWRTHKKHSGISRKRLFAYLRGARQAVAIKIGRFHEVKRKISLGEVGAAAPPQSFVYLPREALALLAP